MDDETNRRTEGVPGYGLWLPNLSSTTEADLAPITNAEEMKRIYGLVDRIKSHSEVRQIAEDFLTRSATTLHSLKPAIQPLIRPNKYRWRERQVAAWILGIAKLEPKQRPFAIESLIKLLERKLDPEPADMARKVFWRSLVLSCFLALPIAVSGSVDPPYPIWVLGFLSSVFPTLMLFNAINNAMTSSQVAAEAARSLGHLRATESLDALVNAAQTGRRRRGRWKRRVRFAALEALPAVLMTLTSEHYGQIRSETMQGLCRLLPSCDETLALAIVNAFGHVGDSMALGPIEKLAAGDGRAAREPRVHQAAQIALPLIQTRVARARDPHQLLRGSTMPATPIEQLLRPSTETTITDPMELLRASADPDWKGTEEEVAFVVRILQHLQESGDTRALAYVERIADGPALDARIRTAAHQCLPILRAHHELERYSPSQTEPQPNILGMQTNL